MKKIMLTGFDPFDGEVINPSYEMLKQLPEELLGVKLIKVAIPTVFYKAVDVIREAASHEKPDVILSVGQAKGAVKIRLEKVAVNLNEARICDNEGQQPTDELIVKGGPDGLFTNLPVKQLLGALKRHEIPAEISYSAGTFVCNHVMYNVRYHYPGLCTGFIHIPLLPVQGKPNMPLEEMVRAMKVILESLITGPKEKKQWKTDGNSPDNQSD